MQPLPHHYQASAQMDAEVGPVSVNAPGLPTLFTHAPAEYGGPGDHWSPETLLMAAVVDCYCLSFRAIARASQLNWQRLHTEVTGTLDKVERVVRFTSLQLTVVVQVSKDAAALAEKVMQKAKDSCLVSNSLVAPVQLNARCEYLD